VFFVSVINMLSCAGVCPSHRKIRYVMSLMWFGCIQTGEWWWSSGL